MLLLCCCSAIALLSLCCRSAVALLSLCCRSAVALLCCYLLIPGIQRSPKPMR
jgi:hypothetical protein